MTGRRTLPGMPDAVGRGGAPVLVVEDDATTSDVVRAYLEREGYATVVCSDGGRALDVMRQVSPRCVVLDVMLPGRDGFEICQRIRDQGTTVPILMLSARADELDRITGLRLGADDYLVKPFAPGELVARVQALLRRAEIGPRPMTALTLGNLSLVPERQEATVDGRPVELTRSEFSLLAALLGQPGRVLTRSQLIDHIHPADDIPVVDRTVDVHVVRIRAKLDRAASDATIGTVRGVGYKVAAAPRPAAG